KFYQIF
ncbi:Bifunctional protein HldE, partial [Haemophilus influenzae]